MQTNHAKEQVQEGKLSHYKAQQAHIRDHMQTQGKDCYKGAEDMQAQIDPIMDYVRRFQRGWGFANTYYRYEGKQPDKPYDFIWYYGDILENQTIENLTNMCDQIMLLITPEHDYKYDKLKWVKDLLGLHMKVWSVYVWHRKTES